MTQINEKQPLSFVDEPNIDIDSENLGAMLIVELEQARAEILKNIQN